MAKTKRKRCACETGFESCCHTKLAKEAIRFFGLTDTLLEAGYILPDGRLLDFSGRRNHPDYEWDKKRNIFVPKAGRRDEQANQRVSDHREVQLLKSFPKEKDRTYVRHGHHELLDTVYTFLIETGAARVNQWAGVELAKVPTQAQAKTLARLWYRDFPDMRIIDVEMWVTSNEIKADSSKSPVSAAKILQIAKDLFAQCRCVSGFEPCCHLGKAA